MTNTTLLKKKINESGLKIKFLAASCNVTERTFNNKLKGRTPFVQDEILVLRNLLHLSDDELTAIFFAEEVENSSTEEVVNG